MLKTVAMAIICICSMYLFGGCCKSESHSLRDSPEHKADFTYETFWYFQGDSLEKGENVPDEYSFLYNGEIYLYSVAKQKLTQVISAEENWIKNYAIDDDYIFFITREDAVTKLWKYDRMADTCKLFTEMSENSCRLALYGGYVFYGGKDINVCPADGNSGEDSVSFLAQFPEGVSADEMPDVLYQGWHIRRGGFYGDRVLFVKDEENTKVILTGTLMFTGMWLEVNGKLVCLDRIGPHFYYQREDEQEKHTINCLEDNYYYDSGIVFHKLAVEDGKIICLIPVSKTHVAIEGLSQSDVAEDILVEIDIEEGTDRIIYNTGDNQTRVIAYRRGTVYLIEDDIIYRQDIEGGDREMVFDLHGNISLYINREGGRHTSIDFIVWGDSLIMRCDDKSEIINIPLFDQTGNSQGESN